MSIQGRDYDACMRDWLAFQGREVADNLINRNASWEGDALEDCLALVLPCSSVAE